MSEFRIVKRKARGFFKPEDLDLIKGAVKDVHIIISNASILIRAHYLRWFQLNHPLPIDQTPLEIDHQMLSMACNIVQGDTTPSLRGEDKTGKKEGFNHMLESYKDLYGRLPSSPNVFSKLSLSHIMAYSIETLLTAYETNVTTHFEKYPKRWILCDLLSKGVSKDVAKDLAFQITQYFLYDFPIKSLPEGLDFMSYEFLFPPKKTVKELPRCWDLKVHPWTYLYKMVQINQSLEIDFPKLDPKYRKLFNPLPFHSSFIPMHIRLDTSGLSQLLMTKERIKEFKKLYELEHPGETLNMDSKTNMLSSFEKLLGRPPLSNQETGEYATDMWSFLTNLKTCKHWTELDGSIRKRDPKRVEWVFDNAVVTDGVSISFQVISKTHFGRKVLKGRKKVGKRAVDADNVLDQVCTWTPDDLKKYKVLGCDPGKRDILSFTDGFKSLRYTKGQRDQDTYKNQRTKETIRRRRKAGLETYETQVLNRYTKKSCHLDVFKRYAELRKRKEEEFLETYRHPVFRQFKFTVFSKTRSSEHRCVDKVFKTFSTPVEKIKPCMSTAMKQNVSKTINSYSDLLIGWGNWGKSPNALKGMCPTPGIGIRKRFSSFFKTMTVNEYLTSQCCPCCKGERCLKKIKLGDSVERHHLLRCTNENCKSRWWNRNVAASLNILSRVFGSEQFPADETIGNGRKRRQPLKSRT
jgi:hypothetical protein